MEETSKPKKIVVKAQSDEDYNDEHFMQEEVIHRDYATTGATSTDPDAEIVAPLEQVGYNPEDFNFDDAEEIEITDEGHVKDDEEEQELESSKNEGLSNEQILLNKKVQKKIAESQSKTITQMYCFILLAAVKFVCKVDEDKILTADARGELNANQLIANLPLIQHIKNGNTYVAALDIDDDAKESIREALEIYMTAMNIQTSPGMNLAIAMITPAITLFMDGLQHKKTMKNLIKISKETFQVVQEQNNTLKSAYQTNLAELNNAQKTSEALKKENDDLRLKHEAEQLRSKNSDENNKVESITTNESIAATKKKIRQPAKKEVVS